jgi:hypothetical protein
VRDGRWDFCCGNRPVGYCAGFPSTDNPHGIPFWDEHIAKCEEHRAKFHEDGHATAEEAAACYLEHELDFRLREWESRDAQRKCRECGEWTTHVVQVGGYSIFVLCPEHATREIIKRVHGPVGEIWES